MESKSSRYQSRILREMHQNKENPFSPASSTGSHGTVTMTSELSHVPDLSVKLPAHAPATQRTRPAPSFNINTSVLGRTFPEWKGFEPHANHRDNDEQDMWDIASNTEPTGATKENIAPSPTSSVVATPGAYNPMRNESQRTAENFSTTPKEKLHKVSGGSYRTVSEMQPTVQDDTEYPAMPQSPLYRKEQANHAARQRSSSPGTMKHSNSRGGNVTTLLETLKTAQAKKAEEKQSSVRHSSKEVSPKSQPPVATPNAAQAQMSRRRHISNDISSMSPAAGSHTARSFFLPNLTYMNDFVSGALRWSSLKNGIPIFVKNGKVHDAESKFHPDHHAQVEAIAVPEDEEKIFVSLDKIREEIHELKEHDEVVTKQAEQLQEEVYELQTMMAKYKSRKDSAMGSDSEGSMLEQLSTQKHDLEEQVASLQSRLDAANRKISINEIHHQSFVSERDEALKNTTDHAATIQRLEFDLKSAHAQLNALRDDEPRNATTLELENKSLRSDNNSLRKQWKTLREENQSLRSHISAITEQNTELEEEIKSMQAERDAAHEDLDTLQQKHDALLGEKSMLKEDNLSLERHNEKFYHDNKALQHKNSLLERRQFDLQDEINRIRELLDAAEAATGTMTVDAKDVRNRLQTQNRNLTKHNSELEQHIIDMQAEYSTKRLEFQQEKRRLLSTTERLTDQLDQLNQQFHHVVKESREEAAKYEEQQITFTQRLQEIANRELTLASQLKESADQESSLRQRLDRKSEAVREASQLSKEINKLMQAANSKKKAKKMTRIIDPKGRHTTSEMSARSTTHTDMPLQDDYTQQIDLSQGSPYDSVFTKGEMPRLRENLRQARFETQPQDLSDDSGPFDDGETDEVSQSIPLPPMARNESRQASTQRAVSNAAKAFVSPTKTQPPSILKTAKPSNLNAQKPKSANFAPPHEETLESVRSLRRTRSEEMTSKGKDAASAKADPKLLRRASEDTTGRFSVNSGLSSLSIPSNTSHEDLFHKPGTPSAQVEPEATREDFMTSALFMDDITLESQKKNGQKAAAKDKKAAAKADVPKLTSSSRRVLDGLCCDEHSCVNCMVCLRINSFSRSDKKTRVRVERPVAVTDRARNIPAAVSGEYEDQPTLRPSQDPAAALAKIMQSLKDEERHIKSSILKKQAVYDECDPSMNKRIWKRLDGEIQRLQRHRDLKRGQIYDLHDVLEGQKANGQELDASVVDVTVSAILSKDPTWNGIIDL
ncbi:hypothetical protein F4780DRAFT_743769 [Xylariomycetidae sp. FL0641]|nr:hypothetical protein F4780DRAFT_743769 [Xylariomycetidae sp. FL0641]